MRKLLPIFLLLLACLSAKAASQITASITITNLPVVTNTFVVNGVTRTWSTNGSATTILATNSIPKSLTNLTAHLAAYPLTGPYTITMNSASNFTMLAPTSTNISVTFGGQGWARVTYSTQTLSTLTSVVVPDSAITNRSAVTNIASGLVNYLAYASNTMSSAAPAFTNFLTIAPNGRTFTNVIFRNPAITGGAGTNFGITNAPFLAGSNVNFYDGSATNIALKGGSLVGATTISGTVGLLENGGAVFTALGSNLITAPWIQSGIIGSDDSGDPYPVDVAAMKFWYRNITIPGGYYNGDTNTPNFAGNSTGSRLKFYADGGANIGSWLYSDEYGFPSIMYRHAGTNTTDALEAGGLALDNLLNYRSAKSYFVTLAGFANSMPTNQTSWTNHEFSPILSTPTFTNALLYGTSTNSGAWTETSTSVSSLANGHNNVAVTDASTFVKLSGPSANFYLDGLTNGWTDRVLTVRNDSGYTMTIANESGLVPAANRISTVDANDFPVATNSTVMLKYLSSRWTIIGGSPYVSTNQYVTIASLSPITNYVGNATNLVTTLVATNSSGSNIVVNFDQPATEIYATNNLSFTNYSGIVAGTAKSVRIHILPQLINRTVVWPTLGAPANGVQWKTNQNSNMGWTTLTNGSEYVLSLSSRGTNIFAAISEWK